MSRILVITREFYPLEAGAAIAVTEMCRALKSAGHKLSVVAMRLSLSSPTLEDYCGIRIARIEAPNGRLGRLRYILRCLDIVKTLPSPDLVYGQMLDIHGAIALVLGALYRRPAIIHEHGAAIYESHRWCFRDRIFNKFCVRFADLVLVLSRDCQERLSRQNRRPRIHVLPWPFSPPPLHDSREVYRTQLGFEADLFHLLAVGRLANEKGISFVIRALKHLLGCKLHILGDGPLRGELEHLAITDEVTDRIIFYGKVPRERVFQFMKAADVLVLPSLNEALGVVMLEAMSLGLPVIASRIGGPQDYIKEGRNGLLVPPGDVGSMVEAVGRIRKNSELKRRISVEAARVVRNDFNAQAIVRRFEQICLDLGIELRKPKEVGASDIGEGKDDGRSNEPGTNSNGGRFV